MIWSWREHWIPEIWLYFRQVVQSFGGISISLMLKMTIRGIDLSGIGYKVYKLDFEGGLMEWSFKHLGPR